MVTGDVTGGGVVGFGDREEVEARRVSGVRVGFGRRAAPITEAGVAVEIAEEDGHVRLRGGPDAREREAEGNRESDRANPHNPPPAQAWCPLEVVNDERNQSERTSC